jgi:ethanolamine utilization protein EutA
MVPGPDSGRIFFTSTGRDLVNEDIVELASVGIDIGSSTSHLVFSQITLERLDARYIVSDREVIYRSPILLTPYCEDDNIDAKALGDFFEQAFDGAGISPNSIDTGALILTGVAMRRHNARTIGDLFSEQAGKFVAVSAGDGLETLMAAYGAGAVARSIRDQQIIMNIDVGGGTSKIAVCRAGKVVDMTAVNVGARLLVFGPTGRIMRIEQYGRWFLDELGLDLRIGEFILPEMKKALAKQMADRLFEVARHRKISAKAAQLLRLAPLHHHEDINIITFSGGVSEFIYGDSRVDFSDLGPQLAAAIRDRVPHLGAKLERGAETVRATVIGASQYTVQVSGSTIFISPRDAVPVKNVAVITPSIDMGGDLLDERQISQAVQTSVKLLNPDGNYQPVAVCVGWSGSATFQRLNCLGRGIVEGLRPVLDQGHPLVLVTDCDIGGLLGIHCREELGVTNPVISIDGIELRAFDFIDIGELLDQTGAVPVVIKSLVFPGRK